MSTITLPNIRVSSDLTVGVVLKDGGVAIDWSTLSNIKAYLYADAQRAMAGRCAVSIDETDSTRLVCAYRANKPQYIGVNRIVITCTYRGETKTYDKPALNFVRWTDDQAGQQITIDDPDVDVEIEVEDVSSSLLDQAIAAALAAAAAAEHAASLIPNQVLLDAEAATAAANAAADAANAAGITSAQVSIADNEPGTPSAEVSLANKVLSIIFHHLKGNTGDAAGFGTITATVDDVVGDPSVTVTVSGPDTAKNFTFAFHGLRGIQGVPGVANAKYKSVDTLPTASAATMDFIYLTPSGTSGVYNMSYTEQDGSTYSWQDLGTTAIQLSDYATKAELSQLEHEVNGQNVPDTDITPTYTSGYYYSNAGTNIAIFSNGGSKYSGTVVNTTTPPSDGIDVSGYIGRTIKVTMDGKSSGSSRQTLISDSSMTYLVGYTEDSFTQDEGETTYSKEFVVPANAKWLFWSATKNLLSIVVKGAGRIDGLVDRIEDLESETQAIASALSGSKAKTDFLTIGQSANLFNKNDADVVIGKYLTGNTFYTDANYNVSGYIPVSPGTTYYGASGTQPFRFAEYYDSGKNYLSGVNIPNSSQFTTPASCAFVRVTFYADRYATAQVAATSTAYVAYSRFLQTVRGSGDNAVATLKDVNTYSGNVLAGKKWVACGDSFTHGDFSNAPDNDYYIESGIYAGQYKVYPYLIGNRNNMVIVNEAVNGSPMTYVGGNRYEFSTANGRYTQIPSDADYITLKFGINDDTAHLNAPIGTITDNVNTTFYGAWNIVLDYLIQHHPQAKIGIIVTNGSQLPYVNAIIAIAEKWGIPYLNEATDKQCSFMFRSNRTDVVQSVRDFRNAQWFVDADLNNHPNAAAHEYESTVVEAWLRTL